MRASGEESKLIYWDEVDGRQHSAIWSSTRPKAAGGLPPPRSCTFILPRRQPSANNMTLTATSLLANLDRRRAYRYHRRSVMQLQSRRAILPLR